MQFTLKPWHGTRATAWSGARVALVSAALLTLIAGGAMAEGIMLQVSDAPLREVVKLLTAQSGANLVIADGAMLEKKVTAQLNDVSLENALDYVVRSAGVSYEKMADGTYIIGGVVTGQALSRNEVAPSLPPVEVADPEPVAEKKIVSIKLIHSSASELLRLLGWDGTNPQKNCEPIYPDRTQAGKREAERAKGGLYLNGRNGTYDASKGIHMENNQPVVPMMDPTSLNPGAGRTADQNTGAGQYTEGGRPPGFPGGGQTQYGRPSTNPTNPNSNTQSNSNGNFLWPDGVDDARPFDLDNSIIVKGDDTGIEKFKKIIRMLDVAPKQVQVKAEFVEVSTTDVKNFGIDWSLQRLNESFATAFNPTGDVVVGFASGNLTAQLKAQLTSQVGRVINSPIISTINNQNAYISIQRTIPYWVSIATVVGDNNIINQATPQFIDIDTHLDIMPRVNGDGTITMVITPGVADTGNQVKGPDGTVIPEQRTQELFTQRRVANGETIVVGGFVRKNDTNTIQKVPILGDLPIVGSLFRTTSRTTEDRELLIFITPTIIPDVGGGTVGDSVMP